MSRSIRPRSSSLPLYLPFLTSEKNSLMLRNVSLDDVGKSGLYLLSDLSSGVTGEVHYVDCGYNKVGVPREI